MGELTPHSEEILVKLTISPFEKAAYSRKRDSPNDKNHRNTH